MAVLLEGEALALSSRSCTGKSVVYVKLTDSALKSLEESVRQKVNDETSMIYPSIWPKMFEIKSNPRVLPRLTHEFP